jgi:hypothetical protein
MRRWTLVVVVFAGLAPAVQAQELAGHRAFYDLSLQSARGDVTGANGGMAYEVIDACDGWAIRQRLRMTITNRDGQDIDMLSDYTTWESKDGLRLRFRLRQTTDDAVTSELAGEAALDAPGGAGKVRYTISSGGEAESKDLPAGTLFPMAHTSALLQAAKDGKKFLSIPLFDGTSANGGQDSTVAIANWVGPQKGKWKLLDSLPSGRVRIAFFDREGSNQQPDYEVGMRYWDNGVADELSMDFGDFVMRGLIKELAMPASGC